LQHDTSWYKFNANVMVYDATADAWSTPQTNAEAARAGAAAVAKGNTLYVAGGEIKPRVRTATTLLLPL
jgi:sialate O-acetylesterase